MRVCVCVCACVFICLKGLGIKWPTRVDITRNPSNNDDPVASHYFDLMTQYFEVRM